MWVAAMHPCTISSTAGSTYTTRSIQKTDIFPTTASCLFFCIRTSFCFRPRNRKLCERLKRKVGPTAGQEVFDYHHYRSTAHELLVVLSGNAVVQIGGPVSDIFEVGVGDALLLPGGLAHKCETASRNFMVLAAYPNQQRYDIKKGKAKEKEKATTNILKLALPQNDPFFGNEGPMELL